MNPPSIFADEKRRLEVLKQYNITRALPWKNLDDITQLATQICEMPISLITFVDEDKQRFIAKMGLETSSTSREVSFCTHALQQEDLLIVPDAAEDSRFVENPLVTGEPGIRFYAGAPLVTPEKAVLGTLCVIDRVSRQLTPIQEKSLEILAQQVMTHLELHRRQCALEESELGYRMLFEANPLSLFVYDTSTLQFLAVNQAAIRTYGYSESEFLAMTIREIRPQEDQAKLDLHIQNLNPGQNITTGWRHQKKNGDIIYVEILSDALTFKGRASRLVFVQDITEHYHNQQKIQETDEQLRVYVEHNPSAVAMLDVNLRYVLAGKSWMKAFNLGTDSILGKYHYDVFPEIPPHWKEIHQRCLQGIPDKCDEEAFQRLDGSTLWLRWEVQPWRKANGEIGGILMFCEDITNRKMMEARFRRLIDSNAQGVFFWNNNGEVKDANDAFLKIIGYTREDLEAGRINWLNIMPSEYHDHVMRSFEEIALKGFCTPFEKEYICKDGSRVPVLVGRAAFEDNPQEGIAYVLDLTERKNFERQFFRSQRLESIGTLAGGIAHNLNNMLAPIMTSVGLLQSRLHDSESKKTLSILESSVKNGAAIVKQILSFARAEDSQKSVLSLYPIIADIEKIISETFFKSILVEHHFPLDLWNILGDSTQLHQVILNLCVNARDAMPQGGILSLSAKNLILNTQDALKNPEIRPGPYLLLEIRDTGTGMTPEVMEKIFDPFFTTKPLGKGTGLGLSTSISIVKNHGGFIRVESVVNRGTTFKIYLPAVTDAPVPVLASSSPQTSTGQNELILVVDDEESIRLITKMTLEAHGYRVLLAANGVEAIRHYSHCSNEIAAVITDMTMPVMSGAETIEALLQLNPGLPIIATSGLSSDFEFSSATKLGIKYKLPKPYRAEKLLDTLRQAIGPSARHDDTFDDFFKS